MTAREDDNDGGTQQRSRQELIDYEGVCRREAAIIFILSNSRIPSYTMTVVHLQHLFFIVVGVLSVAATLPPALAVSSSSSSFTLPIYTFRLDLTIREDDDDRRQLLTQNGLQQQQLSLLRRGRDSQHHHRSVQEIQSVESAIQSVAEMHLAAIYAETFVAPPSQVLLTVVPEEEDAVEQDKNGTTTSSGSGIHIISYFLGGVASFPTSISESSSTTTTSISIFDQLPTRSELAQVTLEAFQIPGNEGEQFLSELQDVNHPDLKGLLLIGAEEVKTTTAAQEEDATGGGEESSPSTTATPTTTSDETNGGSSSVSFMNMNIWAIAAVAALAAMLLVILFCTSILYCDWRKRKERRERKREHLAAMTAVASNIHNSNTNHPSYYDGSFGDVVDNSNSNKKRAAGVDYLQIVVPTAGSGETEDVCISPSTQGGSGANTLSSPQQPQDNNVIAESFHSNTIGRRASSSSSASIRGNKVKKYRRSSLPKSKKLMKKKQSKAANDQLRLADDDVEVQQQHQQHLHSQSQSPLIVDPGLIDDGNLGMEVSEQYSSAAAAANQVGSDPNNILITGSVGEDGYSVGEDTTVLFPSINRDRSGSKDYMSDFDGYSIDGMSAVDGGYSQFGGDSSGGGGGGGGVRSSSKKSSTRDMYYVGDVPRDFDSVWGDDDASRITNDTTDGSADYPPGPPAAKNTFALNKLVEHEEGSQSASAGRGANLHEFETESETSGSRGHVAGAFTLELLGKSKTIKLHKNASGGSSSVSITPSSQDDDDDSILGRMYHDEESSELMAVVGDDDMSAIDIGDGTRDDVYHAGAVGPSRSGDSVDSTPSWAAPIQSALLNSVNKFRSTNGSEKKYKDDVAADDSPAEKRTKDKFISSLKGDDSSVGSNRSRGSHRSNKSSNSRGSNTSRKEVMTASSSNEKALGLTNSMDEEIDEDPTAMIDNINSMLSECREILDTENSPK